MKKIRIILCTLLLPLTRYRILTVGKIKKLWIKDGINFYLKRLPGITIKEIRDSNPKKETEHIISSIKKNESPIVLSEEYDSVSSIDFADKLKRYGNNRLIFIIGGADGLTSEIKKISSWQFSLSPLTFPHEIAQLLLVEQLYRAQTILDGGAYHRS